jgi:hypothetical protein
MCLEKVGGLYKIYEIEIYCIERYLCDLQI